LRKVGRNWEDLITLRCADRRGNLKLQHKPVMTAEMRKLIGEIENILSNEELILNG
jgi:hypothetical protein